MCESMADCTEAQYRGTAEQDVSHVRYIYCKILRLTSLPCIEVGHVLGLPSEFRITLESAREGDHLDVVAGRDFSKVSLLYQPPRTLLTFFVTSNRAQACRTAPSVID